MLFDSGASGAEGGAGGATGGAARASGGAAATHNGHRYYDEEDALESTSMAAAPVNVEMRGSLEQHHPHPHHHNRVRARHSCCMLAGRYCGPFLLFLTLGAVLGGIIVQHSPASVEDSPAVTQWAFETTCDQKLVKDYDKPRYVQTSLCLEHSSSTQRFARRLDGDTINFLVIGDWGRDGMCCQRDVAVEMGIAAAATRPLGILNTGDNFYPLGIPSATHEQVQTSWENVYNVDGLENLIWYSVLGNHDHYGTAEAELDMHNTLEKWHMPDRYYAELFQAGRVSIEAVFLDTTPTLSAYNNEANVKRFWQENGTSADAYLASQIAFVDETFTKSTATWKIVVAHHPVYTSSEHYFEDHATLREKLRPVLDKHKVAVYFNGHDHGLEEHAPESASSVFVLSGAGSQVRPDTVVRDTGFKFHAATEGGFVSFSANTSALLIQYIDFRGVLLHETQVMPT
ncbi:Purple acid phosphatase 17 [Hondaea fermentalgiana]|uniref:Purple acid phosphatase 17 n=1 Tax=Hondaea fermentalgiana TaxID=2315210 RepID=A0A2R5G9X2_9STRA|nr:Purple acid phosphatase 17 [Hondaea fermentalgiana]|eukprot:GBG27820.1 Purple acid phosphatase 17 [Hondaea fermentalgiana]